MIKYRQKIQIQSQSQILIIQQKISLYNFSKRERELPSVASYNFSKSERVLLSVAPSTRCATRTGVVTIHYRWNRIKSGSLESRKTPGYWAIFIHRKMGSKSQWFRISLKPLKNGNLPPELQHLIFNFKVSNLSIKYITICGLKMHSYPSYVPPDLMDLI